MTGTWSAFVQEGSPNTDFQMIYQAETEELPFSNYGVITEEQITDENDPEPSLIVDQSTSDSSDDGTDEISSSEFDQLVLSGIALKEELVGLILLKTVQLRPSIVQKETQGDWNHYVESQRLTLQSELARLRKNVNNIILHLVNLEPFLTEIKGLIKEIMMTISDNWKSNLPFRKQLWHPRITQELHLNEKGWSETDVRKPLRLMETYHGFQWPAAVCAAPESRCI